MDFAQVSGTLSTIDYGARRARLFERKTLGLITQ